jgi:hypothetical protein
MLFDLRGRGRRRTVQVIYLGLAVLFLLGFVGFGVGVGGGGGGLFNAFTENKGSNGASFAAKVEAAQKRVKREPHSAAAWQALTNAQVHQAGEEAYSDPTTGQFTSKGKEFLAQVSRSWNTYLKFEPHNPNTALASQMFRIYSEEGLNQPAEAVAALQIIISTKSPSEALFAKLAQYSYKAHNASEGDLATKKALALAPKSERAQVKAFLEAIKKNPSISATEAARAVPAGTYTTTVAGKKTVLKSSGNGTLTVPSKTSTSTSGASGGASGSSGGASGSAKKK